MVACKKFEAEYSHTLNLWHVETTDETLDFWIRYLRVTEGDQETAPKNRHQIIKAENAELLFEGKWLVLTEYENLKKASFWPYEIYNPDQPVNLAKSVTVP